MNADNDRLANLLRLQARLELEIRAERRKLKDQPKRRKRTPLGCGTDAGYHRHRYLSEGVCDDCRAAHAAAERTRSRAAAIARRRRELDEAFGAEGGAA